MYLLSPVNEVKSGEASKLNVTFTKTRKSALPL